MLEMLEVCDVTCPYCSARFQVRVDCSAGADDYYEDCEKCCSPIRITTVVDDDNKLVSIDARREDESD
jgi:hypothetical protein